MWEARFHRYASNPRVAQWTTQIRQGPSALIVVLPLMLLLILAILVGIVVFVVLSLIAKVLGLFTSLGTRRTSVHVSTDGADGEGRVNVRVMRP